MSFLSCRISNLPISLRLMHFHPEVHSLLYSKETIRIRPKYPLYSTYRNERRISVALLALAHFPDVKNKVSIAVHILINYLSIKIVTGGSSGSFKGGFGTSGSGTSQVCSGISTGPHSESKMKLQISKGSSPDRGMISTKIACKGKNFISAQYTYYKLLETSILTPYFSTKPSHISPVCMLKSVHKLLTSSNISSAVLPSSWYCCIVSIPDLQAVHIIFPS